MADTLATVSAVTSSGYYSSNVPENAYDGDLGTKYNSNGGNPWLMYDLGSAVTLVGFRIRVSGEGNQGEYVQINGSLDDVSWDTLYYEPMVADSGTWIVFLENPETYRYWQVQWWTGGDWFTVAELEPIVAFDYPAIMQTGGWANREPEIALDGDTATYIQSRIASKVILGFESGVKLDTLSLYGDSGSPTATTVYGTNDHTLQTWTDLTGSTAISIDTQWDEIAVGSDTEYQWYAFDIPSAWQKIYEIEYELVTAPTIGFAGAGSETFVGNKVFDLALTGAGSQTFTGVREVQNSTALTGAGDLSMTGGFYSLFTGAAAFPGAGALGVSGVAETDQSIAFSGTGTLASDGGRVSDEYEGSVAFAATGTGTVLAIDGRPYRPVDSGTWYRKDGRFVFIWGHMRSRKRGYPAAWEAVSPRVRYVDVSDVEDVSWPVLTANSGDDAAVLLGKMRTALDNAGFRLVN